MFLLLLWGLCPSRLQNKRPCLEDNTQEREKARFQRVWWTLLNFTFKTIEKIMARQGIKTFGTGSLDLEQENI